MGSRSPGWDARTAVIALWIAACTWGCGSGFGGTVLGVGSTPNRPPGVAFRVRGEVGMPFNATVSDATSTWVVQGSVPLAVEIVNNDTPARMVATKLSPGNGILSLQLTAGFVVEEISSTTTPFGVVSVQTVGAPGFAPPPPLAFPDVRFYVKAPAAALFSSLLEDTANAFVLNDRAPTMFLFDSPNGNVKGQFTEVEHFGNFVVDLIVNGKVATTVVGGPVVEVDQR